MLEDHEFCDNCPGCRPVMAPVDPQTGAVGQPLPQDSPEMKVVDRHWDNFTTWEERRAFIEVTLHNSRVPKMLGMAQKVMREMQWALNFVEEGDPIYFAAIWSRPKDYPDKYVVRLRIVTAGVDKGGPLLGWADTIEEARGLIPAGSTNMDRWDNDDPYLVEVWMLDRKPVLEGIAT